MAASAPPVPASEPLKPETAAPIAAAAKSPEKTEKASATATAPTPPQPKPAAAPVPPSRPATVAPKPAVAPPAPLQTAAARPPGAARFTVQLGAFSSRTNAEALLAKARSVANDGRIVASSAAGKPVFRVVAGSFATQAEATAYAAALKKGGYAGFVKKLD